MLGERWIQVVRNEDDSSWMSDGHLDWKVGMGGNAGVDGRGGWTGPEVRTGLVCTCPERKSQTILRWEYSRCFGPPAQRGPDTPTIPGLNDVVCGEGCVVF